jgi:hypothetical protein
MLAGNEHVRSVQECTLEGDRIMDESWQEYLARWAFLWLWDLGGVWAS